MGELEIGSLLKCKRDSLSLTYFVIYCKCTRISACVPAFSHYTVYTQIFMVEFVHVCNHQHLFLHAAVMRGASGV